MAALAGGGLARMARRMVALALWFGALGAAHAAEGDAAGDDAAARDAAVADVLPGVLLSGAGQPAPPDAHGVSLRSAYVPDSGGAELLFVGGRADVAFDGDERTHGLRAALQWGQSTVAAEDRTATVLGNLRFEYWSIADWRLVTRAEAPSDALRTGHSVGFSFPLADAEHSFFEQRSEVTVPSYALWYTWHGAYVRGDIAVSAEIMIGLGTQPDTFFGITPIANLDATLLWRLADGLGATASVVLPGQFIVANPTILLGARWRPIDALEIAAGTHIALRGLSPDEPLHPLRPVLEVQGRF